MSAFFDILLSKIPVLASPTRSGNTPWHTPWGPHAYLSTPKNTDLEKSPFFQTLVNERFRLILIGQFYEKISLDELLLTIETFLQNGGRFTEPAGHFAILMHDLQTRQWHVFTNRFGTTHLYYANQIGLSTSFLALASLWPDKKLNKLGIGSFMVNGFFPDDHTYYQDFLILLPASHYHFSEDFQLLSQQRYWQWHYAPEPAVNKDASLQEFHDILTTSLSVATENINLTLPISGGLDSRTLAGALTHPSFQGAFASLKAFSYGYTNHSQETSIAAAIAAARKLPFESFKIDNFLFDKIGAVVEAVELFQYVDGTRQAGVTEWMAGNGNVVIGGHLGDLWMNDAGLGPFLEQFPSGGADMWQKVYQKKIKKKGSEKLKQLLHDWLPVTSTENTEEQFIESLRPYEYLGSPDFQFKAWKTDRWSFRWTLASIRMYQSAAFPVLPFYDRRIGDFFSKIPTEWVAGRGFQIDYLKTFHPDLAAIKWQEYDANLYWYKWWNNRNIAYRVYHKLYRSLSHQKTITRNWEVFYLNPEGKNQLETLFFASGLGSEMFDKKALRQFFDEFYQNPDAGNGYAMSMLHTLFRFLQKV